MIYSYFQCFFYSYAKIFNTSKNFSRRFFDLGYLKFDSEKGVFISKELQAYYDLENTGSNQISQEIAAIITKHLNCYEHVITIKHIFFYRFMHYE